MIFRKQKDAARPGDTPLQRIQNRIASEPALRLSVLDISHDQGTLVVLCSDSRMNTIVKMALKKHWPGRVEVFCATDLIMGGSATGHGDAQHRPHKYLN